MNVVAEMLLTEPTPAAIWAVLMVLTLPAMLLLGSPQTVRDPRGAVREIVAVLRERGEARRARVDEAVRAVRFADEVRTAADRAGVAADRWRDRWQQTEQDVDDAWQAWLAADARVRTARTTSAFGVPWTAPTCAEFAARERFLHRTVAAAADRGDLPVAAVADALAGRAGWDPRLHPLEQQLVVEQTSAAYLRDRYEQTRTAEKIARHDADLARRAAASLHLEATTAAGRAAQLSHLLPAAPAATGPRRRVVVPRTA